VAVLVDAVAEPQTLTEHDIPWLSQLFAKRYAAYPAYDPIAAEGWFRNRVLKEPMLFLPQRTDNAFCISMLSVTPWLPIDYETNVVVICAEDNQPWEALRLLRASIEWSKRRRCKVWRLSSDTYNDMTLFARRLGADELSPRYVMRL
jgi:hypothetical protein